MKTVLIVEDEKMIRQGLKTMIKRSGVPVELIMECNNGETALEMLYEQEIDMMFTDIRMPKMDGITLVQKMQDCNHIPITIAISGYDDFQYAVNMMRQGVREYLLKPIERDKITEIMQKAENEIKQKEHEQENSKQISQQQLKYLILNNHVTEEETQLLQQQYERNFYPEGYYVICVKKSGWEISLIEQGAILLEDIKGQDVLILDVKQKNQIQEKGDVIVYAGISNRHQGILSLREAYQEAWSRRKKAFCKKVNYMDEEKDARVSKFPQEMMQEAEKQVSENVKIKRVQLVGTNHEEMLIKAWKKFFGEVRGGRIDVETFEECMMDFFEAFLKIYKNTIGEVAKTYKHYEWVWDFVSLDEYEDSFLDWLRKTQNELNSQTEGSSIAQKMQSAVSYIKEHYDEDINMAVISNLLSMNYSLFSFHFKQYTGKNFVNFIKDIRMEEAKKLLEQTDTKVIQISRQVGYDNEKHFMKTFKASFGISPSEYRKNMRKE